MAIKRLKVNLEAKRKRNIYSSLNIPFLVCYREPNLISFSSLLSISTEEDEEDFLTPIASYHQTLEMASDITLHCQQCILQSHQILDIIVLYPMCLAFLDMVNNNIFT